MRKFGILTLKSCVVKSGNNLKLCLKTCWYNWNKLLPGKTGKSLFINLFKLFNWFLQVYLKTCLLKDYYGKPNNLCKSTYSRFNTVFLIASYGL